MLLKGNIFVMMCFECFKMKKTDFCGYEKDYTCLPEAILDIFHQKEDKLCIKSKRKTFTFCCWWFDKPWWIEIIRKKGELIVCFGCLLVGIQCMSLRCDSFYWLLCFILRILIMLRIHMDGRMGFLSVIRALSEGSVFYAFWNYCIWK